MPMTVPTLVTVAWSENPLICSFSRSLISVARTAMLAPFSRGLSAARAIAWSACYLLPIVSWMMGSAGGEPRAQAAELIDDAAVDQLVAHPHDDTADDARVHVRPHLDILAGHPLQHLADGR